MTPAEVTAAAPEKALKISYQRQTPRPRAGLRMWLAHPAMPAAAASAVLACVLYAVTLAGTYVYDDREIILIDPRVRSLNGWMGYFRQAYFPAAPDPLWRPLTCLTYWAQWHVHGDAAWAFHLANILLHAGVASLVAALAWQMTRTTAVAWWAGLLFAAHPVHVEVAANIVGRAESLCTLGILAGLTLFTIRPYTKGRAAAIVACFALAALSKEHGVLLPPMLVIWFAGRHWLKGGEPSLLPTERRALQWLFIGLSFGLMGYTVARESIMHLYWDSWFLRWTVNPIVRAHGLDRALLPISVLGRYAALLIFPWRLSPDYGARMTYFIVPWNDPYLYLGAAAILGWTIALILAFKRRAPAVATCLVCAALAYALISNTFMMIGIIMGERLIYLTSAFVILLAAMTLATLPRRVGLAAGVFILSLASLRTATYAWRWNDALRLFSMARQEHPQSVYLYVLESDGRIARGDLDGAAALLTTARALEPESQNVWGSSAKVAKLRGDPHEAEYQLKANDLDLHPPQVPRRSTNTHVAVPPPP